ncbi:alpha,alpha-trehalase [Erwinia tasmaniensis]|uniref:Cytoplasmic trehalase n=1 Tax=Erwinia tasmaniensis (strain DSM 17950 / CFBP 7177 / CIP 109463 / NCPPB 4357 / Et1/99) TaxID=465817 RepID=B2VCP3_ERWT9|nr:Cytoplasmic trehalase (Alpha,alpha-trehalose glucohydrolase) [Erwinia tasmaniensis Et1/99]
MPQAGHQEVFITFNQNEAMINTNPVEFEAWHDDYITGPEDVGEPHPERIHGLPASDILTPSERYQELFTAVQMSRIFSDSKTFADCAPKTDPEPILFRYYLKREQEDFNLLEFVLENFDLPDVHDSRYVADPNHTMAEHIDGLWPVLTRQPEKHRKFSSLLPLPKPYVVPGGRFSEVYYWDSYFSMLGFAAAGRCDLMRSMADNFAWMIDKYGHIPNGNRTYYLSRSQPPVFAMMVELFEKNDVHEAQHYLPQLKSEYAFWMDGQETLAPNRAHRHVVMLSDGSVLNRYWDDRDTPRDESYREDVETAGQSSRPSSEVYRDLRAGAASGWDYTSRWLSEPGRLESIQTTSIVPVDLNALLYKLETTIARLSASRGEQATAERFQQLALRRREAVDRYLWDVQAGLYRDYNWREGEQATFSAAAVTPVYVGMASLDQANRTAKAVRDHLLAPGGILCSMSVTGEQWDSPNGWAPVQWMAIKGFHSYGDELLAQEIASRWLHTVNSTWQQHHKMVEKYNISGEAALLGGGGEYPLQDGFGWTNGVTRRLLEMYPQL